MKTIQLIAILLISLVGTKVNAQTVALDFESGDRNKDAANCWQFGAVGYSTTSGHRINGSWVGRGNSLSNPNASACWIKSPFLKPGSGNISFNVKLENTSGTTKGIVIRFISYDENNNWGEGSFLADSFNYSWPSINTSSRTITYAIPNSIANSGDPYKVMISFVGTGGNNRPNIDDIVIPGTYWADPSNNCKALPNAKKDSDGDKIADEDDAYPNDKYKAFKHFLSSEEHGTLMCEDLWPSRGDYDFNDLVIDYRLYAITDADDNMVEMVFEIVTRAVGGSYHNGFACEMIGIDPTKIVAVTGNKVDGSLFKIADNGLEADQKFANVPFFDDAFKVLKYPGGTGGINTNPDAPRVEYDSMVVVVKFIDEGKEAAGGKTPYKDFIDGDRLNPYIVVNQDRKKEIHLVDMPPTSLASQEFFGKEEDASDAGKGLYYRSKNNLPWMISVAKSIPYPTEKTEFSKAFTHFVDWAASEGQKYEDWYLEEKGYREEKNLFLK